MRTIIEIRVWDENPYNPIAHKKYKSVKRILDVLGTGEECMVIYKYGRQTKIELSSQLMEVPFSIGNKIIRLNENGYEETK